MALSKLEIQQMLREMNVKFDADESYEELRHRLQQENHSLWLKSVSGDRSPDGGSESIVVRRRKKKDPTEIEAADPSIQSARSNRPARSTLSESSARRGATDHGRKPEPAYQTRTVEKPAPGKPWKSAADGTEPFNRTKNVFNSVLQRAKRCCERCGKKSGEGPDAFELEPCYIQPISQGGEHSIKNMVALCPACSKAMETDPSAKEIKDLKRKTRSRLYDSLQVVRKKSISVRRPGHPADRRK
jgi:5-methylcytosine-specific restriction enzyme A